MSASAAPAMRTMIAFQLALALERYQHEFDEMVESRADAPHYRAVTRELQEIRVMRESLPQLSEEMAEVLVRHVQLVHVLWNGQARPRRDTAGEMKGLRQRHVAAVEAMRRKCVQICGSR